MNKAIQYYAVGFNWSEAEIENQLPRFLKEGIWENGFEDRYLKMVNSVVDGSRIAAKTTYTRKLDGRSISILKIHALGTVTKNYQNGKRLKVKWDSNFKPFEVENRGAYRSTIGRINNFETIKLIFKDDRFFISEGEIPFYNKEIVKSTEYIYPCFVLTRDRWDDFGYKTQYDVEYHTDADNSCTIGNSKFLNLDADDGDLPEIFTVLNDSVASLGQSNYFYENLRKLIPDNVAVYYLDAVNDLAINKGLIEKFEYHQGFSTSLIRSSEAQKALREGNKVFKNIDVDNVFKFKFSAQIGNAIKKHSIRFNFEEVEGLPFRIKVLIGKNGTGKTQYISKLASTLSGYQNQGEFSTKYVPPFSRVITVSYSLFDRFPRPTQTKTFSYYYCGFQSGKGFLTENQINSRLKKAFQTLFFSKRVQLYGKYLSQILNEDIANEILDEDFVNFKAKDFTLYDKQNHSKYSSGQIVLILMLAEVVAYVTDESLIIFDEPETHLHPNSISLFINVLNKIVSRFNSYSIISTHSPQIIQEVPSKDIVVLERIDDVPSVRKLDIESFGENLNAITEKIFHTASHDEYYRSFFSSIHKKFTYDEIVSLFESNSLPLSFNARIFLQSLYNS
jgi:ABC-type multidrug transport system ATPase subunit